jgi:hypothetical protein
MPIHIRTWLGRLSAQCPGWYFWYGSERDGRRTLARRARPRGRVAQPWRQPGRVDAATPQQLRELCQRRYGWDEDCRCCQVPARQCGHRIRAARSTRPDPTQPDQHSASRILDRCHQPLARR